jgi:hypothetical protein
MDNIRLIIIPLEKHLIITVNKCASSTLIELIGEGNELFCTARELPDIIRAHRDKKVVGILREPYDRFASGLLEEVKRSLKLHVDLFNINRNELERIAQLDQFWKSATELYFEIQGVCVPDWTHSTLGYTSHCGNWLTVYDYIGNIANVKLVHMHDLNQFLHSIGYTDVKMFNKTSDMDYVVRLEVAVQNLNRRFADTILPSLAEYNVIRDHLAPEQQLYDRLMARASSQK